MWVSMIGTRYGTPKLDEKMDVIKNTKKDANLDAIRDANMGATAETKLDEKYGCNGSICKRRYKMGCKIQKWMQK